MVAAEVGSEGEMLSELLLGEEGGEDGGEGETTGRGFEGSPRDEGIRESSGVMVSVVRAVLGG